MEEWTYGRMGTDVFPKPKCFGCIDNQISLPMVLRYNEICLLFFTSRWAYNKGRIGGGEGERAPFNFHFAIFLVCNRNAERT